MRRLRKSGNEEIEIQRLWRPSGKKQKEKGIIDSTMLSGFSRTNKMMTKNLLLHLTIQKSSPTSTAQFGGKSNGVRL